MIFKILNMLPFLNRFNKDIIIEFVHGAKVEYFNKNEIIFLDHRIGVITHGSIRVRIHNQEDLMKPLNVGRFYPGRILGHSKTDNGLTTGSQTWFEAFDEKTEVVFFEPEIFERLWRL